jgi:hypothetical protein
MFRHKTLAPRLDLFGDHQLENTANDLVNPRSDFLHL